jgi:hypothetical protein
VEYARAAKAHNSAVAESMSVTGNVDMAKLNAATNQAIAALRQADDARKSVLTCLHAFKRLDQALLTEIGRALMSDDSIDVDQRLAIASLFR